MNTSELRDQILDDINNLRTNKISTREALARAALYRQLIDTLKVEVMVAALGKQSVTPLAVSTTATRKTMAA